MRLVQCLWWLKFEIEANLQSLGMYMEGVWKMPYANMTGKVKEEQGIKKYWERFCTGIDVKYTGLRETEMEWIEVRV